MKRILFVCLGNICRSPGAEAILKAIVKREGREADFHIDSAGLYSGHAGAAPDARMQKHAARRGYNLDSRARTFYPSADFPAFDLIIGMDDQNVAALRQQAASAEETAKIRKMTDFCQRLTSYSVVPDPYYGGDEGFELVLDLLEDAAEGLFRYCSLPD